METKTCFDAWVDAHAHVLILGSMPGEKSLAAQQYYAHPRNAFWAIMENITQVAKEADYAERMQGLRCSGIALWDVVAACQRQGSLDSDIVSHSIQTNDFATLFTQYPNIRWVGLNGKKALALFERWVVKPGHLPSGMRYQALPSTSPAYASLSLLDKQKHWLSGIQESGLLSS